MKNITSARPELSVVTPVYGCDLVLYKLYDRLRVALEHSVTADFEIIMVWDGSPSQAWTVIQELAAKDPRVKGIRLSRNFGQHAAITAGLDYSRGSWVAVMDCDLQDMPEELPKLYHKALEGYEVVFARRSDRQDRPLKVAGSKLFYGLYNLLSDRPFDPAVANFSVISGRVAHELSGMREQARSYPLFLKWLGFDWAAVDVRHAARGEGRSGYNFKKLVRFAADCLIAESNKPLRLSITLGFWVAGLSLVYGLYLILRFFLFRETVPGWTSVMVSIYFIGGLLFSNLGIIGLYLGKIFDEAKARPLYVVQKVLNGDAELIRRREE